MFTVTYLDHENVAHRETCPMRCQFEHTLEVLRRNGYFVTLIEVN